MVDVRVILGVRDTRESIFLGPDVVSCVVWPGSGPEWTSIEKSKGSGLWVPVALKIDKRF